MKKKKNPKYNNSGKTKEWFPIRQFRFKIDNHPIVLSSERRAAKIRSSISGQEQQILAGVALMLQVPENEAIRICLYEATKAEPEVFTRHLSKARSDTAERLHKTRNHALEVRLPNDEKQAAENVAEFLGITPAELLRLAVIRLALDVRDERLKRLSGNSYLIANDKLAMNWTRENDGTGHKSTLTDLKTAAKKAEQEAWDREYERQKDWEERIEAKKLELGPGLGNLFAGTGDYTWLNAQVQMDIDAEREDLLAKMKTDEDRYWYRVAEYEDMGMTEEEAKRAIAEEDADQEPLDEETLRFCGLWHEDEEDEEDEDDSED